MNITKMTHGLFVILLFISHWAFAQTPTELQFQSRFDQFQLLRSGGKFMLGDKRVQLGSFEQFLPLFNKEIEGTCNIKGKADLTVKGKYGAAWVERRFYITERVVSDGKQCATIGGDGLYFSPLHRSWFDDSSKATIDFNSPVTISRKVEAVEEKLASFEQVKGEWRNALKDEYPNWEFFASFKDSLRDFTISHRVHKAAIVGKAGFTLTSGKRKYEFYKIGESLWVTTLPGNSWLVASARWTAWGDMEKSQWVDRSSGPLTILTDENKTLEERRAAMGSFEGTWTPSIRQALVQILISDSAPTELKQDAVRLMKSKPSLDNMGTLVEALSHTTDSDLQHAISMSLKTRNPKGPTINVDLEDGPRRQAIAEWQKWWKGQKDFKHDF